MTNAFSSVAFVDCTPSYPQHGPFSPDEFFPEYPFDKSTISSEPNYIYKGVRESFRLLELDILNYGSPLWNPLKEIIKPGDTVVIKPNWVYHRLLADPNPEELLITHPSILRAVLDYVIKACLPGGKIIIGDAPLQSGDFREILKISQIDSILSFYSTEIRINLSVVDFRKVISTVSKTGQIQQSNQLDYDSSQSREVNLGHSSFFSGVEHLSSLFRVPDYDPHVVIENHQGGEHKYLISSSILDADVVINLPKLKSHKQCGITGSLKNLVGINSDKAYLPHFRSGPTQYSGDEYPKKSIIKQLRSNFRTKNQFSGNKTLWAIVRYLGKLLIYMSKKIDPGKSIAGVNNFELFSGCWYGNDSAWRMVLDLNLILFFADSNGTIQKKQQRTYLSIIDAIISGEGHGPLEPKRKKTGAILAGFSPVATDVVAIKCMGFDQEKIPLIKNALVHLGKQFPFHGSENIQVRMGNASIGLEELNINWHFEPPRGWKGHIELD